MSIYVPVTMLGYMGVANEARSRVLFLCLSNWTYDCSLRSNDYVVMTMSRRAAET